MYRIRCSEQEEKNSEHQPKLVAQRKNTVSFPESHVTAWESGNETENIHMQTKTTILTNIQTQELASFVPASPPPPPLPFSSYTTNTSSSCHSVKWLPWQECGTHCQLVWRTNSFVFPKPGAPSTNVHSSKFHPLCCGYEHNMFSLFNVIHHSMQNVT